MHRLIDAWDEITSKRRAMCACLSSLCTFTSASARRRSLASVSFARESVFTATRFLVSLWIASRTSPYDPLPSTPSSE